VWKTLFEHRQQTGRRLIVVLPAEKAIVLAKIVTEKREAFDLLQDAEQATAYGYTMEPAHLGIGGEYLAPSPAGDGEGARLPSSLSLRRCSHFGDTMHFIDRLTQISLDLRMVPVSQRHAHFAASMIESKITKTHGHGETPHASNQSPEWPQIEDMSVEMVKNSIHFPLIPQMGVWPSGQGAPLSSQQRPPATIEVARALNIVVPETRVLASRERCPFLVHLELADTGLEGSDARLYASGVSGLGSTVEEALNMGSGRGLATKDGPTEQLQSGNEFSSYEIPPELLDSSSSRIHTVGDYERSLRSFPRGGSDIFYDPYDAVRQQEYEQLHQQMQAPELPPPPSILPPSERPVVTLGADLLDKVFGRTWNDKCEEIRQASPYGQVKGWRLASFIMKAGEDIRREALVMQIISKLRTWFDEEIPEMYRPFMRPYSIMAVGGDAGLVECLSDAVSIDELKKQTDGFESMRNTLNGRLDRPVQSIVDAVHSLHLVRTTCSSLEQLSFEQAQDNFLRSLVGILQLVCYVLQIRTGIVNILPRPLCRIYISTLSSVTPKWERVPIFSERAPFKLESGVF
jgi:phosphatidylinositol 4-kinase